MQDVNSRTEQDLDVRREQAAAALASQKLTLAVGVVLYVAVGILLWGHAPGPLLVGWMTAGSGVYLARLVHMPYLARDVHDNPGQVLRSIVLGSSVGGILWAAAPWLVDDRTGSHLESSFLYFTIAGIVAGQVTRNTHYRWTSIPFFTPVLLSVAAANLDLSDPRSILFCGLVLLFVAMMVITAFGSERQYLAGVRMVAEQRAMAASLAAATEEISAANARLRHLADHDPLTGLLNRTGFDKAFRARASAAAERGEPFALLRIELDGLKAVNDAEGHAFGDHVLVEVAQRLRGLSGADRRLARLDGDEFVLLCDDPVDPDGLHAFAEDLVAGIGEPLVVNGTKISCRGTVGIAVHPRDGSTPEELIARADVALHAAKKAGRRCVRSFDRSMSDEIGIRRQLEREIGRAIDHREITVHYQPQIALDDGRILGFEALLRWNHPQLGFIAPPQVLAAARRRQLSCRLTELVMETAAGLPVRLAASGIPNVRVAVNVSPDELMLYPVPELVERVLARTGCPPTDLEIEITEDAIIDLDRSLRDLERIRAGGVRVAIDDFGAGYSSFASLSRFKADRIKIDRQFVTGLTLAAEDRSAQVVRSMIALARSLGAEILAEGVENEDVANRLGLLGCTHMQGYLFGRPMPESAVAKWIADWSRLRPVRMSARPRLVGIGSDPVA